MSYFTADLIYTDGLLLRDHYFEIHEGMIRGVAPLYTLDPRAFRDMTAFENALVVPGFVNTHTHSFQSLLKGFFDDRNFFDWRTSGLYHYGNTLTEEDIYVGAMFAFTEMLKQGITTVCDFFYLNDQGNENARAVIRAAKTLGIRLVLARALYDGADAPERFRETVAQAKQNTTALMAEYAADPMIKIIPAPHSLHAASPDMLQLGASLAEEWDTVFHVQVAEGRYEREQILERTHASPMKYLDSLGVLNPRFIGVYGVWLTEEDIALMAARKAGVSYNPSSSMFLGNGVGKLIEMMDAGIVVSLGTSGGCSNNRASIVEEMRMASLLQKVIHHDPEVTTAEQMLLLGTRHGGKNLNLPLGRIASGCVADFSVIDLDDLSMQPRQNAVKNLVYSMMPSAIQAVYVSGHKVYDLGEVLTFPESKVVELVQKVTAHWV